LEILSNKNTLFHLATHFHFEMDFTFFYMQRYKCNVNAIHRLTAGYITITIFLASRHRLWTFVFTGKSGDNANNLKQEAK